MSKYNSTHKFNQLNSVTYNEQILKMIKQVYSRVGPRPIILNQEQEALAVLENSYDVELEQEENGMDELYFSLPFTDAKRDFVMNENLVQMFDTIYVIREVGKRKSSNNPPVIDVFCEAIWYDLQFADPLDKTEWVDATAYEVFSDLLQGTGWSVGTIEIPNRRTLRLSEETDNRLKGVAAARNLFGGIRKFDTVNKKLHLLQENTKHSGLAITYQKNMEGIEAIYDTKDLVTRLFLYGKNGLTIESANDGKKYIENYSYTNKRRVRSIKDERFTNPYYLKEFGEAQLAILSKPRATYRTTAFNLADISKMSHERFEIGYIVRVYDKDLDMDTNTSIKKWKYNVIEPWRTRIELETKVKGLSELLAGDIDNEDGFSSGETVDRQDLLELMVFNYLLNSRADDGFSYWENSGWEIDAVNGYSGPASFKTIGTLGQKKELKQTVYPSHRDAYSLSFRSFTENLVKGPNGRVGINIKITYEDGTTGEKFISLA